MPESAVSSPAMIRSIVVLPPPDGPSSATSSPDGTSKLTSLSAVNRPNVLLTFLISMAIGLLKSPAKPGHSVRIPSPP